MAQALYRKYRSRSFDELAGQEHIAKTLSRAVEQGAPAHAYLFTGPRGIGKTSAARILAHGLNRLEYSDQPHLDIIEIDAASNRRIEDVRDLREKVHIAPASAPYKIYIIDEVHMLTAESFNALLKTLEEPPAHVVFILATTELHKLPATITSRTQRFAFAPPSIEAIAAHLGFIAKQEKIAVTDEALKLLAAHAEGSFRDGISLLDQVAGARDAKTKIDEHTVAELLGLPPRSAIEELLAAVTARDPEAAAARLTSLKTGGTSTAAIAAALIRDISERAHQDPVLSRLLDELLAVPKHPQPDAKLLSVLLNTAHRADKSNASEPRKPKSAPLQAPKPETGSRQAPAGAQDNSSRAADTGDASDRQGKPAEPPKSGLPSGQTGGAAERWSEVLAALPAGNAPLRGTLKKAQVRQSTEDGGRKVTLAFKYGLHSKKMEVAKSKQALAAALESVLGIDGAVIETVVDGRAEPTPIAAAIPAEESREQATAVMETMGGGEIVEAQEF